MLGTMETGSSGWVASATVLTKRIGCQQEQMTIAQESLSHSCCEGRGRISEGKETGLEIELRVRGSCTGLLINNGQLINERLPG